jgi:hypothetical protein
MARFEVQHYPALPLKPTTAGVSTPEIHNNQRLAARWPLREQFVVGFT